MIDLPTTVDILGQTYLIKETTEKETPGIKGSWGLCDFSIHCIYIDRTVDPSDIRNIANLDRHFNKVLRHEIVHAFLDESGLMENARFDDEHFEQMVDWIAIQFPKLMQGYQKLDILS